MRIPLSAPDITEAEIEAVGEVLRGSQLSLGPKLREFEAAVASFVGVDHAVGVSSGTAGLHLAMIALGIGAGDEVIVPSFTFIAAANVIRYVGATPVFVDIDAVTLNVSPEAVEQAITPRTRAMIAVHTFGRPAEIGELAAIARRHGLFLVEDACEALGAEVDGQAVGSFGDVAVFAFYPNKQITTGEGGMAVTADAGLAERMRSLRNQGRGSSDGWFQHSEVGYNYRLSEIACTLGIGQMARLPEILARREEIARSYDLRLADHPSLIAPAVDLPNARVSWFVYVVRLTASYPAADRDAIVDALHEAGIGCGRYFAPIHRQPAYAAWRDVALPVTEFVASRTIALPFFNRISEAQIDEVADCLKTVLPDGRPARAAVTS
jgi:perosamine synthetase